MKAITCVLGGVGRGVFGIVPAAQKSLLSRRTAERLLNDLPVLVR